MKNAKRLTHPNLSVYLIPTMIFALFAGAVFHQFPGFEFLAGLMFISIFFLIMLSWQKKNKNPDKLLNTKQKLLLAEEKIKKLNQRIEELERLDQSKNDFLKILAHDLKSPINSILGLTEVVKLSEDADKKEMEELITKMANAGRNVKMLIDNLMSWCVSNQGRVTPHAEKVSVLEMVKKSHGIYEYLAREKQIDLKIDIREDIYLKVDKDHVFSILRNVINNALKFTHHGGEIVISAIKKGNYGVLKVRDNGVGMEEEKIKELMCQNSNDRKVMHSLVGTGGELGNGLGLTICCDLVALNKGKIAIESVLNKGTLLTVSLPVFK